MKARKIKKRRISLVVNPKDFKEIEKICKAEGVSKQNLIYTVLYQFLYFDE